MTTIATRLAVVLLVSLVGIALKVVPLTAATLTNS